MSRQSPLQPRKQPRQVRAELTRRRILDAAAHVFAEHGYAAGTTNRIAERAKVSIGSLYQYYPGKDAILLELLTRHLDAAPPRDHPAGDLAGWLRATVRAAIGNHRHDPQLLRVMFEQGPRATELMEQIDRIEREQVATLEAVLRTFPDLRTGDIATAARLIVATIELTVHRLVSAPDPVDATRLENEMVAMLTRYLLPG